MTALHHDLNAVSYKVGNWGWVGWGVGGVGPSKSYLSSFTGEHLPDLWHTS